MPEPQSIIPKLPSNDSRLGASLSTIVASAIDKGLFQQEVDAGQGIQLRFGVRPNADGYEFFAVNADTGQDVPLHPQKAKTTASGLTIKLNEFRKLRPSQPIVKPGRRPEQTLDANQCKFGCIDENSSNTLLKRPVLLRISGRRLDLAVMPQLAPLEPLHVLLVPCVDAASEKLRFPHMDQLLDSDLIEDMLDMAAGAREWTFLFNSMHAGATVRHLHLQALQISGPLPIESALTETDTQWPFVRDSRFPGGGLVFAQSERARLLKAVLSLQERSFPLNFVARGDKAFLFPRHPDHEIAESFPFSGFASMELSGILYTSTPEAFEHATDQAINAALRETSLPREEILRVIR